MVVKENTKIYVAIAIVLAFVAFMFVASANQNEEISNSEEVVFNPEESIIDEIVMGEPTEDCNTEAVAQGECTAEEALYVGCNDFI